VSLGGPYVRGPPLPSLRGQFVRRERGTTALVLFKDITVRDSTGIRVVSLDCTDSDMCPARSGSDYNPPMLQSALIAIPIHGEYRKRGDKID
jgi:hypothetical protein